MSETNDPLDAFEALVINASDDFSTYRADNNFKVLALEDGWEIDLLVASLVLGDTLDDMIISIPGQDDLSFEDWAKSPKPPKLWAFRGRLLGKNSPHNKLPMPCFDFVKEIWGDAAAWNTAVSTAVSKAPQNKDQIELLTAQYNQRVTRAHTVFILPRSSAWQPTQPRLGEVWSVRLREGKENRYDHAYGTAIKNESPDTGANFIKIENWKKSNSTTDVYYTPAKEGCDSLLDLFEEPQPAPTANSASAEECLVSKDSFAFAINSKWTNNYLFTKVIPGMVDSKKLVIPCDNQVVIGKNFPALTDITKKEIDWWACGDVEKAWGTKMDKTTKDEFTGSGVPIIVDGVTGWYKDNSEKCSYRYEGKRAERKEVKDPKTGKITTSYRAAHPGTKRNYRGDTDDGGTGAAEIARISKYFIATNNRLYHKQKKDTTTAAAEKWVKAGTAWSAVTISWFMLQVDENFPAHVGHLGYILYGAGSNRGSNWITTGTPWYADHGWTSWPIQNGKIVAQIGDIMVRPRLKKTGEPKSTSTTQTHGDLVTRIAKDGGKTYAYFAGGNISQSMYGWTTWMRKELNSDGTYKAPKDDKDYIILMKKDGKIVEKDDPLVAKAVDDPNEVITV